MPSFSNVLLSILAQVGSDWIGFLGSGYIWWGVYVGVWLYFNDNSLVTFSIDTINIQQHQKSKDQKKKIAGDTDKCHYDYRLMNWREYCSSLYAD